MAGTLSSDHVQHAQRQDAAHSEESCSGLARATTPVGARRAATRDGSCTLDYRHPGARP